MKDAPPNSGSVIDAKGGFVVPGFIDAHCHLGMFGDSIGFEGIDGNEKTDPITPHLRAIDAINPNDGYFKEAREGGVTTVVTGPGSSNVVGGQTAAVKTNGIRIDNMIVKAPCSLKCAFGENPKKTYNEKSKAPVTRMATAALLREALFKAQRYAQRISKGDTPEFDIKSEALLSVLEGGLPIHAHAHRADDIFTAIRIGREFGIEVKIVHATEGHLIAGELAKEGVDVMVDLYPYNSWATYSNSARFDPGWQERFQISYEDLQVGNSTERLTEESFNRYRKKRVLLIAYAIPDEDVELALQADFAMIGSDTIIEPHMNNHPRGAGCFARTIGLYAREKRVISLMKALKMMTILPARRLDNVAPALQRKGRLRVGMDADITVFDYGEIIDTATAEKTGSYSQGIHYVIVNGVVVKDPHGFRSGVSPGKPIRSYFTPGEDKEKMRQGTVPCLLLSFAFARRLFPKGIPYFTEKTLLLRDLFTKSRRQAVNGLALDSVEPGRDLDLDPDQLVAPAVSVQPGNPLAAQAEDGAGLRSLGDLQLRSSLQGRDRDDPAQNRPDETDGLLKDDIIAFPLKKRVGTDLQIDIEVSGGAAPEAGFAFPRHPDPEAVIHPCRDLHLNLPPPPDPSFTGAFRARGLDDLAFPAALLTSADGAKPAKSRILDIVDLPLPWQRGQV